MQLSSFGQCFSVYRAKYHALVEQIPVVVFMAYLDEGVGEAYVSPQIEAVLVHARGVVRGAGALVRAGSSRRQGL